MKKVLFIILISCFSLTIISCSDEKEESTETATITYSTVTIGAQVWMAENLNTSKYRDETEIPEEQDGNSDGVDAGSDYWSGLTTGAWSYYNFLVNPDNFTIDSAYGAVYGKLYNWYAVNGDVDGDGTKDKELCPQGWHVPSSSEFTTLINYLGGSNSASITEGR